jgi:hypothetical protein
MVCTGMPSRCPQKRSVEGTGKLANFTLKLVRPGFGPPAEPAAVLPA